MFAEISLLAHSDATTAFETPVGFGAVPLGFKRQFHVPTIVSWYVPASARRYLGPTGTLARISGTGFFVIAGRPSEVVGLGCSLLYRFIFVGAPLDEVLDELLDVVLWPVPLDIVDVLLELVWEVDVRLELALELALEMLPVLEDLLKAVPDKVP